MNIVKQRANGWRESETELLLSEIKMAKQSGQPLNGIFVKLGRMLNRQPNSIRNYYYKIAKELNLPNNGKFIPFEEFEVKELVKEVLTAQARGESVRGCTLRLGKDKKNMLRLQNKYRSAIKNSKFLVDSIMEELSENNIEFFNPYVQKPLRGRKSGSFEYNLIKEERDKLQVENRQLRIINSSINGELVRTRGKLNQVMGMFNQLMIINREILELPSLKVES